MDTAQTRQAGDDLHAALTIRWSWETPESFAERLDRDRQRRDRKAEAMVQLARMLAEHDLPFPFVDLYPYGREDDALIAVRYRTEDLDTFRLTARVVRRAVGGMTTKTNENGSLTATVCDGLIGWDVTLSPDASPCEQVQVGVETRTEREEIEPARYREVERDVPVYEWRCPDSVLDVDAPVTAEG